MSKGKAIEHMLEPEEIDILLRSKMRFKEEFAYKLLLFTGLRVGSAVHLTKNWINRGEIRVPERQRCNCLYCKQQEKRKLFYHKDMLTKFNSLKKPKDKQIVNWEKHCRTWKKTKSNFGYWVPKTKNAVRKITILPEVEKLFQKFFSKYDRVMDYIPSPASWRQIINNHYDKHLKDFIPRKIFPHCLRSTFATIYYNATRCSELELLTVMGWANLETAQLYVKPKMQKISIRDFTG